VSCTILVSSVSLPVRGGPGPGRGLRLNSGLHAPKLWPPMSDAPALVFPQKGKSGRLEVCDETGTQVATISRRRSRLSAEDALGGVLFTAKIGRDERCWTVEDSNGDPLVELRQRKLHPWPHAELRGGSLTADYNGPNSFSPKWELVQSTGEVLVTSEPHNPKLFNKPWLVRSSGSLSLGELVAVVQMHRLSVNAPRGSPNI